MKQWMTMVAISATMAAPVLAGDVTGKWTGEMAGPDGPGMSISCEFKQDGNKLTGTMDGPGGAMKIENGKVDGDKLSFSIDFNGMKIVHEGKIQNDEIKLTIKMDGGPGDGPGPITLKRAK
jgi:hypothetical protein